MSSKPLFLGVYMAPGVFIGSDMAMYREYLDHVRALAKPKTGEAHQIVRGWVLVQWRLQCLAELERDWWAAFEQGLLLTEPAGEESVLDADPLERLQVCKSTINSWDKLQRMERRLKREAAALLPLLMGLMAEAMVAEHAHAESVAADENKRYKPSTQSTEREFEGRVPQSSSLSQHLSQRTNAVTEKRSSVVGQRMGVDDRLRPCTGSASAPFPGDAVPGPRQGGKFFKPVPPLETPASGFFEELYP